MASGSSAQADATRPTTRVQDLILPLGLIASVLVILVPLPPALMDLLLSANVTVAVIMLLTTLYVRTPLEFSVFPSLLLATTLFRLVLNVATTRLILSRAATDGELAAGGVVRAFGKFVAGGGTGADHLVVGLVIFAIIVLIQFVVITKGATRISEVAARFTLDGMPGKQMAIDADLNAGLIDHEEARRRRQEISAQADFYGAMDGAGKFVRGDAVAGLGIIFINILGGLFLGVVHHGMGLAQAAELFTTLTIGDGLVTQVPAFLISLSAGMLVTRSSRSSNLPGELAAQLFSRPTALAIAGGFLALLIFTSLPRAPLLLIAGGCVGLAVLLFRRESRERVSQEKSRNEAARQARQRIEDFLAVDPVELELGLGLLRLADPRRGGDLLDHIQRARQRLAADLGVVLPKVRVRDNMRLDAREYRVKIAGATVAQGKLDDAAPDAGNALAAHLLDTARRHADELLTRDAVKRLLDELRRTSPAVVDELIPGLLKLGEVQRVLQALLREEVSIRPLETILETLGDWAPRTKNPVLLAEQARRRLARAISAAYRDADGRLRVVTLDPALEERIQANVEFVDDDLVHRLPPSDIDAICRAIERETEKLELEGRRPLVLVGAAVRPAIRRLTAARLPRLVVLSFEEITGDTRMESVGMAACEIADPARPHAVPAPHFRLSQATEERTPFRATADARHFSPISNP